MGPLRAAAGYPVIASSKWAGGRELTSMLHERFVDSWSLRADYLEFLRHDQFCVMNTLNTNLNTSSAGQELSFDPQ